MPLNQTKLPLLRCPYDINIDKYFVLSCSIYSARNQTFQEMFQKRFVFKDEISLLF